jgi:hypothetical protein
MVFNGCVYGTGMVSRKHIDDYYGEADDESFRLLGSRFINAVQNHGKREPHRFRQEQDSGNLRAGRFRPRPVRDRG